MRVKHMPCGVHTHSDYGYQRYPYRPLCDDEVRVQVLVEDVVGHVEAMLHWEVDGVFQPSLEGRTIRRPGDDRLYFAFSFGAINRVCAINYQITVKDERETVKTKSFSFDVLGEEGIGEAYELIAGDKCAYALFKQVTLCIDWSDGLVVRFLQAGSTVAGRRAEEVEVALDSMSLQITKAPFSWQLKRSTTCLVKVESDSMQVYVDPLGMVQRITYAPFVAGKQVVGLGERFDDVDLRGKQLLCRVVEKYSHQGENSYLPIPFFMTDAGIGWFSNTQRRLWLDFGEKFELALETGQEEVLHEEWWLVGEPQQLLRQLHDLTGRALLPPKWAFGIWISANGWNTQRETMEQLEALEEHALPATALVLEAWSDEQTFCIFNEAQYEPLDQEKPYAYSDFTFLPEGKWPNPQIMADAVKEAGLNLVLWQIPVLKYTEDAGSQLQSDEAYALAHGYCVMNDDGTPYRITDNWFGHSLLLDFTNPEAVKWWFNKRAYLIETLHVKGFKTDGGEFLFDDTARLSNGQMGETAHNTYPGQYIKAYHDFMGEHGLRGVTFSRAGYIGAQTQPMHWAGDQLSEWSEFRAQLTAGLSAGLSGIPFWGFDLGGFAGDFPSPELYLRSVAMAAFSPVMQWHSEPRDGQFYYTERDRWNNDRSPWNLASLYSDPSIIAVYRKFANLRMNLLPYIYCEAIHCAQAARPLMAHLLIDWPNDSLAWKIHDQYMFGRDLMVAPLTQEGAQGRTIYLPEGIWHDLFNSSVLSGGSTLEYPCSIDTLPVFVRDGCALPMNINEKGVVGSLEPSGGVGNVTNGYTQLAFLCFGNASTEFQDDLGNHLILKDGVVSGRGNVEKILLIDACQPGQDVSLFGKEYAARLVEVERYG